LSFQLARKKLLKEPAWTIVIVVVMTVGLTGWIVTPAIGNSLRSGLSSYANTSATYVIVDYTGSPQGQEETLPHNLVENISAINGVQTVYPVDINYTNFNFPNYATPPPPGESVGIKGAVEQVRSAVIGGPYGFPLALVDLTAGRLPFGTRPEFIVNDPTISNMNNVGAGYNLGKPYAIGDNTSVTTAGANFTASVVGINSYSPLLGDSAQSLWNATFFQNELGQKLFNETFGVGATLLIVKVTSVDQVPVVANRVTDSLQAYPAFRVEYDQATVNSLLSVETGTAPLYELIGLVSLGSSIAALFFVSYVAVHRRSWEVGLFVSQGWTWRRVTEFFLEYFLLLAALSYVVSVLLSLLIMQYTTFSYQVFGTVLRLQTSAGVFDLASAGLIAVGVTFAISFFMRWRLSKSSLDSTLREY